jgi:hypothetical protein
MATTTATATVTGAPVTTTKTATTTAPPTTVTTQVETKYATLNPRGLPKDVDKVPLTTRLASLKPGDGQKVWVVTQKPNQYPMPTLADEMKKAGYNVQFASKVSFFGSDEPTLWNKVAADAKAVIFGVGD